MRCNAMQTAGQGRKWEHGCGMHTWVCKVAWFVVWWVA